MDVIVRIFRRFEELHGLRYFHYIGDDDNKIFNGILDNEFYGDLTIVKKECINHVHNSVSIYGEKSALLTRAEDTIQTCSLLNMALNP